MKKEWFVLHTLTGQENKVQRSIEARRKLEGMQEFVGECVIPTEKVTEKRDGKTRVLKKRVFPGYALCELAFYDETREVDQNGRRAIYDCTWQFLRATPGLIGFVGTDRKDTPNPVPLTKQEVDAIMSSGKAGRPDEQVARPKVIFNVGDTVKVIDGAFLGQKGTVTVVDPGRGKLTVEVSIFSRLTPVDVEYWQVEKMSDEDIIREQAGI